jgi:hypothetical protein
MVGVFVDRDVVAVPIPVVAVREVKRGDTEVEATEPETAGIAALNAPAVVAAETAVKAAVLPGTVKVEADIVAPVIVSDPFAVVMDVWGFRMLIAIAIGAVVVVMMLGFVMIVMIGRRAVLGGVSSPNIMVAVATSVIVMVAVLRDHGE